MYLLQKEMITETAHLLKDHPGQCKNFHGHSYKWTVIVQADVLDVGGMVMDFTELKRIMEIAIKPFDHALVLDSVSYAENRAMLKGHHCIEFAMRPTAEAMASQVYHEVARYLPASVKMNSVILQETEHSRVTYYES